MASSNATPQRATADKLLVAFNTMDIPTIIALRHPSCIRKIVPESLNHPDTTNAEYATSLHKLIPIFQNFTLEPMDIIEDKEQKKVVMYLKARADTLVGEYVNEYVWFMEFKGGVGEEGLITGWREYVDVGVNRDFFPKLLGEMRKRKAEAAGNVEVKEAVVS